MVTIGNLTSEYYGLSTDEKPTGGRNGDSFIEIDSGKTYLYSESGTEWIEQPASGGGGGGGSSDLSTAEVTISAGDDLDFYIIGAAYIDDGYIHGGELSGSGLQTVTIVLYSGSAFIGLDMQSITSLSGGVIGNLDDGFVITGDCTIEGVGWPMV